MYTFVINVYNIEEDNNKYKILYLSCLLCQVKGLNKVQHIIKYQGFDNVILKISSGFMAKVSMVSFYYYMSWLTYILHIYFICLLQNSNIFKCAVNL